VVIVGGGVSGLATANCLDGVDLIVLEAAASAGGNVRTEHIDGRIIDKGPNGWLNTAPAMDRMLSRLGLSDVVVQANDKAHTRWIYADGKMHPAPLTPSAFFSTSLLPWWAKLRVLMEPFLPRGPEGVDESVAQFVARRLGQKFVDRMVGPMVAGIHAARPEDLSLASAFPKMAEMEAQYRSLFLAMLAKKRGGAPAGQLQTLPQGAGQLTDTMATRLGDRLQCDTAVEGLSQTKDGWRIHTAGGDFDAEAVVLACPAPVQAKLMRGLDAGVAEALDEIPYAPVTVVVSAWPSGTFDQAPSGFGVLAARGERVGVLGTLFTSETYPNQSKSGEILLRTMVGGAVHPAATKLDHQTLLGRVYDAHGLFFGKRRAEPTMVRAYHHPAGIPQYTVGHQSRVGAVCAAADRFGGLFFAGNHLGGIGVKDCVTTGEQVAANVRAWLELTAATEDGP
jgi:oxygen-dependent protoporphyrinogen oxidase